MNQLNWLGIAVMTFVAAGIVACPFHQAIPYALAVLAISASMAVSSARRLCQVPSTPRSTA